MATKNGSTKGGRTKVLAVAFTRQGRVELREFQTRNDKTEYTVVRPDGQLLWVECRTASKAEAVRVIKALAAAAEQVAQ